MLCIQGEKSNLNVDFPALFNTWIAFKSFHEMHNKILQFSIHIFSSNYTLKVDYAYENVISISVIYHR